MRNDITFIDPFAGIGGFRLGLEGINRSKNRRSKEVAKTTSKARSRLVSKAGKENGSPQRQSGGRLDERADQRTFACQISTNPQQGLGNKKKQSVSRTQRGRGRKLQEFHCVWSNEWDKYCAEIYEKNFGEAPDTRDIRAVPSREIPDHDLLCAGWPCQSFSIAGKGAGFEDTRGTLFFEIARIARDKRPRHLLLENVKGLLSHQAGQTFQTILGVLAGLGYRCEWQVLNSKDFGVPQNRERVFIVGHLGGEGGQEIFPLKQKPTEAEETNVRPAVKDKFQKTVYDPEGLSPTVREGHSDVVRIKTLAGGMLGNRVHSPEGLSPTISTPSGGRHLPMIANTVDCDGYLRRMGVHHDKPIGHYRIRKLTPIECERLQGFPDNWTEGVSDTQRYKMLGNAVTVNVIEAIGRRLREVLYAEG